MAGKDIAMGQRESDRYRTADRALPTEKTFTQTDPVL